MKISTKNLVSITEANRNFSRVARLVDENGAAVILKNNVPRYLLVEFSEADRQAAEGDHGKMTVEKLIRKDQGAQQIDIAKSGIKDFERVLNKYGVDYAIRKDVSQEPPRFMVFFKAKDADVLTAAFKEYSVKLSRKEKRPSVLKALAHLKELAKSIPSKVREKNQERER